MPLVDRALNLIFLANLCGLAVVTGTFLRLGPRRLFWLYLTALILYAVLVFLRFEIAYRSGYQAALEQYISKINHDADCDNAPRVVPYRPGITLCPGQSAVVGLELSL